MHPVGLLANPAAGKDIRRIVARASVFDNQEKAAIVRRAVAGAVASGAKEFHYFADGHGISRAGLDDFDGKVRAEAITIPTRNGALATERAAMAMKEAGCVAVLVLGGDGTSRAFCRGWQDAPLLSVSTGTNNVFPRFCEATVAGAVLGCLASGVLKPSEVMQQQQCIEIELSNGKKDIALIDAVVSVDQFVGSRALLDPDQLRQILLTRADPAATGMTCIGGLIDPVAPEDPYGLQLTLVPENARKKRGKNKTIRVHAPIAPGLYDYMNITEAKRWELDEPISISGSQVLAFDGEREHRLNDDESATATLRTNGPRVIDVEGAMRLAAQRRAFVN